MNVPPLALAVQCFLIHLWAGLRAWVLSLWSHRLSLHPPLAWTPVCPPPTFIQLHQDCCHSHCRHLAFLGSSTGRDEGSWLRYPLSDSPASWPGDFGVKFLNLPVGGWVRHYWQNGGTVPSPLSSFHRHGSRDEGVRPCNSDLSFPFLGWIDWKGILRCLLFLRGAWEGTKPSAVVLRK